MSPLGQLWTSITDNAATLGVVLTALGVIVALAAWLWPRKTDPPPSGGDTVHGPKVGGNVGGDAVGRDKTIAGRDQQIGDRFQSHNITAEQVIIQHSGETAAKAAGSRFQLPARNPDFEGRRDKIEEMKNALRAGSVQVTALEGMGGIGKTDTAIEAVHDLVDEGRFKDAQLLLDLQGFSATGRPLAPADALRSLLRPFVPADETLPDSEQELAARFRDATRDLGMLLFLDNARDEAQVEPLLPGHPGCTVLVTSRNRLSLRGLQSIDLAEMNTNEAAALALKLANRRFPNRVTHEQAEEIARLCGCLPISIEVTANALSKSRGAEVAGYLNKLGDRTKPLAALDKAKAVVALSLEELDAETRAHWAALGVFEGEFSPEAAAAMWAVEDAGATLEELEQRSLVSFEPDAKRYHLHDLLRAVALEKLKEDPARQHEVHRRHAEHFFAVLQTANALYRLGHNNAGRGLALLDAELANIRAGQRWATDAMAEDERAAELAQDLPNHTCLRLRLAPDELLAWLKASLAAAERRGDREGEARAAGNLGLIYRMRGELDRGEKMHRQSLAIETELGRKEGMTQDYGNLGLIYMDKREFDRAEEMLRQSLAFAKELGAKEELAANYCNLGLIYMDKGELDRAEEMHSKSLAIAEELGRKEEMAANYGNLGLIHRRRGDMGQAVAYWRSSLALNREIRANPEIERIARLLREAGVDPDQDEAAE